MKKYTKRSQVVNHWKKVLEKKKKDFRVKPKRRKKCY